MAEILEFDPWARDPGTMSREELLAYRETVRARIAQLDQEEPEDMSSEAYEAWGDRHEELEDLADEIADRLDRL